MMPRPPTASLFPSRRSSDLTSRGQEFADTVINHLSKFTPGIKDLIIAGQVITPLDFEETYGLSGGHIHHGEQSRSEEHTSELQSHVNLVCRLLLERKKYTFN